MYVAAFQLSEDPRITLVGDMAYFILTSKTSFIFLSFHQMIKMFLGLSVLLKHFWNLKKRHGSEFAQGHCKFRISPCSNLWHFLNVSKRLIELGLKFKKLKGGAVVAWLLQGFYVAKWKLPIWSVPTVHFFRGPCLYLSTLEKEIS